MLENYKEEQSLFITYVEKIIKTEKINHAYLIETNGIDYAFEMSLALAKCFLCPNNYTKDNKCGECNICKLIDKGNYPDLKIIETDLKEIKKEQILNLQEAFSVKPIYGKYMVYIIKNINQLNKSSANTLLKFLEEPNEDILAIFLTNNIYNVIDTIVSRCQILSLYNKNEKINTNILNKYYEKVDQEVIESEKARVIEFYNVLEENGTKIFLDNIYELSKEKIDVLLEFGMNLYKDVLNLKTKLPTKIYKGEEINKIVEKNNVNDIIKKIDIINQFLENSNYNVNKELFLDNFVITFSGGNNE